MNTKVSANPFNTEISESYFCNACKNKYSKNPHSRIIIPSTQRDTKWLLMEAVASSEDKGFGKQNNASETKFYVGTLCGISLKIHFRSVSPIFWDRSFLDPFGQSNSILKDESQKYN